MMVSPVARSSLEEMLDSLRRKDEENAQPREMPPALPSRPTSKARLPSARRSLPNNFTVDKLDRSPTTTASPEWAPGVKNNNNNKRKETMISVAEGKRCSFGVKKMMMEKDSPYVGPERGGDNVVDYFVNKKLKVWCRLPTGLWESGTIQSTSGDMAFVSVSDGNVIKVPRAELLPANSDVLEGVDDLVQLSFLNDPSVLWNLQSRYSQDLIYNKAGPVLIAMNPFKDVKNCGDEFVTAYRKKLVDRPHIYAVADAAYNEMIRGDLNQSIILSGETGAGKTEMAKLAIQYLAALGGGSNCMENAILQANRVLEAFGNAKTSRNDNASRFGKLLELNFSTAGKICGAGVQTLFLEQSRVAGLKNDERSYHIFYQLCAGAPSMLKERLNLKMAGEYNYLSGCLEIDGVDDAQRFHMLMDAFATLQISIDDQEEVFSMLAAVLWLGNISFEVMDDENHVEVLADDAITTASRLMGCSTQELMLALSTLDNAVEDSLDNRLTLQQANGARDALAGFIYVSLFDWLVEHINKSLQMGSCGTGRSIKILDIYGFESLQDNSFEQLCINYANERLQQHFNRHLLKLEQEECELDGVDLTKVDFEDNQECLDLFEKKPLGLLSLLEEESNFLEATDLTLADKFNQQLKWNSCFKAARRGFFSIHHHAGEVIGHSGIPVIVTNPCIVQDLFSHKNENAYHEAYTDSLASILHQVLYDTCGFLEKSRSPSSSVDMQFLSSSTSHLLQLFSSKVLEQFQKPAATALQRNELDSPKPSLSIKFKAQLFKILHELEDSRPHFVLCIKPNSKQLSGLYEAELVLQQLRSSGVSEVVRISRSGYPTRMTHQEFAGRYGFLLSEANVATDPLGLSVAVLQQFRFPLEMYQIGYTKVYLRTGQIAILEDKKNKVVRGIVGVQKYFRGYWARRHFTQIKQGNPKLRSNVPSENGGRKADTPKHKRKSSRKISEVKDPYSELAELQTRVLQAEETLVHKEEENADLQEQLQQFETRWTEYEARMKAMQDVWQKQMSSLQASLAAARKSLTTNNTAGQPERVDASSPQYDSEDALSMGSRTPGASTPINGVAREANGSLSAVGNLVKEFDQRRQTFDDEAKALIEVKTANTDEELRKLKHRFESWKKEYKARLRETKSRLRFHKHGHTDEEKKRRKWWVI